MLRGPAASIWFDIWGSWIRVKKFDFSRQISDKLDFFRQFQKIFRFSKAGKNCPLQLQYENTIQYNTSEQIILFLFKSHHFRTYFLYMIRYIIIFLRLQKFCPKSGSGDLPNPQD